MRGTGRKVYPQALYTATPTQRFMDRCANGGVQWAIFSDQYGVWFPDVQHEWYEKDPDSVTDSEFDRLLSDFETKLRGYEEVWFYHNPGRFHSLYERVIQRAKVRITKFTHLWQITNV